MKISDLNASEIISRIAQKELSSVEVAENLIEQTKTWAHINSLINFDEEKFLNSAIEADRKLASGEKIGQLHGVPIVVKDNIDVEGFVTSAASNALRDFIPKQQGPVINALAKAGAIIMSKANMHELAFTPGITKREEDREKSWGAFGAARNPYDVDYSPSGSSSGTAAAISAGIAPAGLGTDTGGSIRNPSAWCGINGLRPTIHRYSQEGVVPLSWTRDTIGPMARTVTDLSLFDTTITGDHELPDVQISKLRIGTDPEFFCKGCDPDIYNLFNAELERLSKEGAEIIEIKLIGLENLINQIGHSIVRYEVIRALSAYFKKSGLSIEYKDLVSKISASGLKQVLNNITNTEIVTEEKYDYAINHLRPALKKVYLDVFSQNKLDIMAFPSSLVAANKLNDEDVYKLGKNVVPYLVASSHNVQPATLCGNPGLTIPIGLTTKKLPAAIGFDAPLNHDRKLLSIGIAYEKIKPPIPRAESIIN